jgi:hypothetical protein
MERTFATALALLVALPSAGAWARDRPARHGDHKACDGIYRRAQSKAKAAHLREAKELLQRCARTTCGTFLMQACTARYTQLDADIPSVVPVVTDATGDGVPIEVSMDSEWLTSKLDGRAVPVDPGRHEFTFSKDGNVFATEEIMILPGQRNRVISVSMHPAEPEPASETKAAPVQRETKAAPKISEAPPPASDETKPAQKQAAVRKASDSDQRETPSKKDRAGSGTSAFAYIFGLTGLAGVGGYGVLTYWGRKDNRLLGQCSPNCLQSSVDHVKKLYLAADVSLGVGLVALVASTYLFASSGSETSPKEEAVSFRINPTPSGAIATIGGGF